MSEATQETKLTPEEQELKALRAELAAARSARESVEDERERSKGPAQLREEIAAEKRAAKDLEVLIRLEAEIGPEDKEIRKVVTTQGMVIVKRPNHLHYRKFADLEKVTSSACGELVRSCLAHPDKETFNAMAEKEPAILLRCANAACWLAGNRKELDAGK